MLKTLLTSAIALSALSFSTLSYISDQPFAIAIHVGAGTIEKSRFTPEQEKA